jgi:ferredoxin
VVKLVKVQQTQKEASLQTNSNLLSILQDHNAGFVPACGGRGMCATCHVFIKDGLEQLSPIGRREKRTLEIIGTCRQNSRLACQAKVIGEGVIVELPSGLYVSSIDDIDALIGRRSQEDILHPISGEILVEEGKLITRSMIAQLKDTQGSVEDYLLKTESV